MPELRKIEESIFKFLMRGAFWTMALCLAVILFTIIARGLPAMSVEMLTSTPKGGFYLGGEGGILNAIIGSLLLAGSSCAISLAAALPAALYMNVYLKKNSLIAASARFSFDVLTGVPSIVYGAFGFALMLTFGMKASLLAGSITVAILIFPVMVRAMDEVFKMTPPELSNVSYSLGATRLQTSFSVILRQSLSGVCTAVLISFGRAIGDAASVLFTAGFSDSIPTKPSDPAATLPLAIFFQLGTPSPEVQARAYASALVLTIIILAVSLSARAMAGRLSRHKIK